MTEAAVAEVTIIPVSKGASGQIERDLGQGDPGGKAGKTIGGGLMSALGGVMQGTATTVVASAATAIGVALVKGFNRLDSIDQAGAKLRGLGNDADSVKSIMGNALASVKGTSFGLGDAATTAAGAVAAGIKPGQELERVLKSVTNSAAAAGTGMGEMGSIYNKVASLGKAQNDVLQQVADKGIPIYAALAKNLGVTSDEVFKMASAGRIGFAEFEAAMTDASGTVAQEMGETIPGSIANFTASLGRIGAGLQGGIFPLLAPMIQSITAAMGPLESKAAAVGQILGEQLAPAFEWIGNSLRSFADGTSAFGERIESIKSALGPLAGIFIALGAGGLGPLIAMVPGLGGLGGALGALAGPFGLIAGAILGLIAVSPALQAAIGGAFGEIAATLQTVFAAMGPSLDQLMSAFVSIADVLGGVLAGAVAAVVPFITQLLEVLGGGLTSVLPLIASLLVTLGAAFGDIMIAIMPLVSTLLGALMPIFESVIGVVVSLAAAFIPIVEILLGALVPVIQTLVPVVMSLITALAPIIPVILNLASSLISMLVPIISALAPIVTMLIQAFLPLIGIILTPLIELISALIPVLMPIIDMFIQLLAPILGLIEPLMQLIGPILGFLAPLLVQLIQVALVPVQMAFKAIIPILQGVVSMITGILTPAITMITDVLGGLINFLTGVFTGNWQQAWDGIVQIFSGIFNGIAGIASATLNGVIDVINGVIGGLNEVAAGVKAATGGAIDLNIPLIPHLARGGIVPQTPGGQLAVIGEGRYDEAVIPLTPSFLNQFGGRGGSSAPISVENKIVLAPGEDPRVSGRQFGRSFVEQIAGVS